MLVLSRKPGEQLQIGNDVTVTVLGVRGNVLKLGIQAPGHVRIIRAELEPQDHPVRRSAALKRDRSVACA